MYLYTYAFIYIYFVCLKSHDDIFSSSSYIAVQFLFSSFHTYDHLESKSKKNAHSVSSERDECLVYVYAIIIIWCSVLGAFSVL